MSAKIYLPVVEREEGDTVFGGHMPIFKGDEDENLACGACKAVLGRNVSTRTLFNRLGTQTGRILLWCECGAYNVIRVRQSDDA